jgi:SAM-dependent methyltransferase
MKRLHIGSGAVYLEGYVNVDLARDGIFPAKDRPDLVLARKTSESDYYGTSKAETIDTLGVPRPKAKDGVCDVYDSACELATFEANSCLEILSRQMFEHLSIAEARRALGAFYRVLAPGGTLRIDVPDHDGTVAALLATKDAFYVRHLFGTRRDEYGYHFMSYTRECLRALAAEHGFAFAFEEPNIHFYPAFCLRFRKGLVPEERPMSPPPKILFVDTYYPAVLRSAHPRMAGTAYAAGLANLLALGFGTSDFASAAMRKAGWQAADIVANADLLQAAWRRERGKTDLESLEAARTAIEQIREFKADAVAVQSASFFGAEHLEELKREGRVLALFASYALDPHVPLELYDVMFTSFPHYEALYGKRVRVEYLPLAFAPEAILGVETPDRDLPVTFVGGMGYRHIWRSSEQVLETLAREVGDFSWWGYGAGNLPETSRLKKAWRGEAWGREMYRIYRRAKIVVNRHGEIAQGFANNMRLFEATGSGALVLTEEAPNLCHLFLPGQEIACYSNAEDLVRKVRYYLEHDDERDRIAKAGRDATHARHTFEKRGERIDGVLRPLVAKRRQASMIISGKYEEIPDGISAEVFRSLGNAWKHREIPERNWTVTQSERDRVYRGDFSLPIHATFLSIMKQCNVSPRTRGTKILEVGAGSAFYGELLKRAGLSCQYEACDYSEAFRDFARQKFPETPYTVADATKLPWKPGEFRIVILGGCLYHVEDWRAAIREATRVSNLWVVATRNPVSETQGRTKLFRKLAYDIPCPEWTFDAADFWSAFQESGLVRTFDVKVFGDEKYAHISAVFRKEGATA